MLKFIRLLDPGFLLINFEIVLCRMKRHLYLIAETVLWTVAKISGGTMMFIHLETSNGQLLKLTNSSILNFGAKIRKYL